MKMLLMRGAVVVAVAGLAACAGLSHEQPVTTSPSMAGAPPSQMPQSPNSLPLGSQVSAPFTSSTGVVGTTRVGP